MRERIIHQLRLTLTSARAAAHASCCSCVACGVPHTAHCVFDDFAARTDAGVALLVDTFTGDASGELSPCTHISVRGGR